MQAIWREMTAPAGQKLRLLGESPIVHGCPLCRGPKYVWYPPALELEHKPNCVGRQRNPHNPAPVAPICIPEDREWQHEGEYLKSVGDRQCASVQLGPTGGTAGLIIPTPQWDPGDELHIGCKEKLRAERPVALNMGDGTTWQR
jgi:hypothetical protein